MAFNELNSQSPPESSQESGEQERSLEPYSAGVLARAYRRLTSRERKEEGAMERAAAGPQKGELE